MLPPVLGVIPKVLNLHNFPSERIGGSTKNLWGAFSINLAPLPSSFNFIVILLIPPNVFDTSPIIVFKKSNKDKALSSSLGVDCKTFAIWFILI